MAVNLRTLDVASLRTWLDRERRRKELEREARQLKQANDLFEGEVLAALQAAGKSSVKRHGFELRIEDGRASVSWKNEFLRVAGPEEADRIQAAAPVPQRLSITPPPESADVCTGAREKPP